MAEQEQEKKRERLKQQRFNRRINFYVMRYMWQVVRGRNATDRIYECLGMSRERYTRAINTGSIRCSSGELDKWEQLTGISKKIFQGEDIFVWHDKNEQGHPGNKANAVSMEQWKEFFAWKGQEEVDGQPVVSEKRGKSIEKTIRVKLKNASRTDRDTHHFFQLCYFLEKNKPSPLQESASRLKGIQQALKTLTFSLADDCDIELLTKTVKLLNEKSNMIRGIITYHTEKKKEEDG